MGLLGTLMDMSDNKNEDIAYNLYQAGKKSTGLKELTSLTQIEPITTVTTDLETKDYITDVYKVHLSLLSNMVLAAAPIVSSIGKVSVSNLLVKINPNVGSAGFGSLESDYDFGLPLLPSTEDDIDDLAAAALKRTKAKKKKGKKKTKVKGAQLAKQDFKDLNTVVGQNIKVTLKADGDSIDVNLTVRLQQAGVDSAVVAAVMANESVETSFTVRYAKFKSGELRGIADLIFQADRFKRRKKLLAKDDTGFYRASSIREYNNRLRKLRGTGVSLAEASNIYIISDATEREFKNYVGADLSNARARGRVFDLLNAMIITVIDTNRERFTMYMRGTEGATSVPIRSIANKVSDNTDQTHILRALAAGQAPII